MICHGVAQGFFLRREICLATVTCFRVRLWVSVKCHNGTHYLLPPVKLDLSSRA